MSQVGRNDPCPCGSGRKYKKCCLAAQRQVQPLAPGLSLGDVPILRVGRWLGEHYPEETRKVIGRYFSQAGPNVPERIRRLPERARQVIESNVHEWLLTEGRFELEGGGTVPVHELVLATREPFRNAAELAWFESYGSRPLSLYEILEVVPAEGFLVQDLLHPEEPPFNVLDREATKDLFQWDILGARIMPTDDGWRPTSSYRFIRIAEFPTWIARWRDELARDAAGDPEAERRLLAARIPTEWLVQMLGIKELPALVRGQSDEPLFPLFTDRYRVRDWSRVEAALAGHPEVQGRRSTGWSRFEERPDGGRARTLVLRADLGDRLVASTAHRQFADDGRHWLQELAGDALEHRIREVQDLRCGFAFGDPKVGKLGPSPRSPSTGARRSELDFLFMGWANEANDMLGGRTPREAVRTPEGRGTVIALLKFYELRESQNAREDGRDPVGIAFLWCRVGLDREEVVRSERSGSLRQASSPQIGLAPPPAPRDPLPGDD